MGGVVGLMPVTGLTLPFFSAGGTSLFTSMLAAGILLNVARRVITTPSSSRATAGRRSHTETTAHAGSRASGGRTPALALRR